MIATQTLPVVVIGAGPAGISLSRRLDRLGIEHLVLERGRTGETWRQVPPTLRLLSPWWTNCLTWQPGPVLNPLAMASAADFLRHFDNVAAPQRARIRNGCTVARILRTAAGFRLELSDGGTLDARCVACCTGYFSSPAPPSPPLPTDGSIRLLHAGQISDYANLPELAPVPGTVLVVGRRVTAGQIALELHTRGFQVAISAKQPVQFRREGTLGAIKDVLYFPYEVLRLWFQPGLKADSFPVMDGGKVRRLVENGTIAVRPRAAGISDGRVGFDDGASESFDLVLLATGYRPALSYLNSLPELTWNDGVPATQEFGADGCPGLFLLGFDNLHDFTSRYLRGIRRDARRLAADIARFLSDGPRN